jgi:hypothetical protein
MSRGNDVKGSYLMNEIDPRFKDRDRPRQHPNQPPKDLALNLAVSIATAAEKPTTTVERAKAYADFLSAE